MLPATVVSASPAPSSTPAPSAKRLERVGCGPRPEAVLVLQTTPACVLPPESVNVSTAYSNRSSLLDDGRFTNHVEYPQTLLRFGTGDPRFDVEFSPPAFERIASANLVRGGATDMELAAKYSLGSSARADYAVRFAFGIPSGASPAFSSGNPEYTGDFDLAYVFGKHFSANVTLEAACLSSYVSANTALGYFNFKSAVDVDALLPGPSRLSVGYAYETATGPASGGSSAYVVGYHYTLNPSFVTGLRYSWAPAYPGYQRYQTIEADLGVYAIL